MFSIVRDESLGQTQSKKFPNSPNLPLLTLQTALLGAIEVDDVVIMTEFMLLHAQKLKEITEELPLSALREGHLERSWELADLHQIESRILWYLVLAWELKEAGLIDNAKKTLERLLKTNLPRLSTPQSGKYAAKLLSNLLFVDDEVYIAIYQQLLDDTDRLSLGEFLIAQNHFDEALTIIETVRLDWEKEKIFAKLALAQASAGQFTSALESSNRIKDEISRTEIIKIISNEVSRIAITQARAGDFIAALEMTKLINDPSEKIEALHKIAISQIETGELHAACDTVQQIFQPDKRAELFYIIANAQVAAGDLGDALQISQQLNVGAQRDLLLFNIAQAQVNAGELSAALTTSQLILSHDRRLEVLREIIRTQLKNANFAEALQTTQKINNENQKAEVLYMIAKAYIEIGDFASALAVAQTYLEKKKSHIVFSMVSQAHIKKGDLYAALEIANLITISDQRCDALCAIATALIECEKKDEAMTVLAHAVECSETIENIKQRALSFMNIGLAQSQCGAVAAAHSTFSQAVQLAHTISSTFEKANTLLSIAIAQAQTGDHRVFCKCWVWKISGGDSLNLLL